MPMEFVQVSFKANQWAQFCTSRLLTADGDYDRTDH